MKKLFLAVLLTVTTCMFFTGCGSASYKGADANVKKLVLKIARKEFRNQLSADIYKKLTNIPIGIMRMNVSYESLKKKAAKDFYAKKAISKIDEAMSKVKLSLTNIRTNKIEKEIKKSYNSATLVIVAPDGKKFTNNIDYTAQVTEDGKLYVEVTNGL
jgi:hypothetical protein